MNEQSEHLSDAQIEQYGKPGSGAGPDTEAWVEGHLDDCALCRSRVLDLQSTRLAFLSDPKVKTVPTSACPSEEDIRHLAAGLCPDAIAAQFREHAASCDRCQPLLQEYIEDFSDESTPEEQAFLDQLRTASPEWRRQTAREIQQRNVDPETVSTMDWRKFFSWKWIMVPATASVAIIAVGLWHLNRNTPERVESLLVQAQTEQRTIEMRWPGAKWTPHSVSRTKVNPTPSYSLLKAEEALQGHSGSSDPAWARAEAEKEIARGDPAIAIAKLASSSSPSADMDRAMAYFVQGEQAHDNQDHARQSYEQSGKILDDLLKQQPNNTVAMFNRAIVYQRLKKFEDAKEAWQKFIETETDPDWRNEAKKQLRDLQELNPTR